MKNFNCNEQVIVENKLIFTSTTGKLFSRLYKKMLERGGNLADLVTKHRTAFTVAEILITLGIIGVIVAITMPSLITGYQKQQTVTKLKKAYSIIYQALNRNAFDDVVVSDKTSFSIQDSIDYVDTYLAPYMQIIKNCGAETTEDCQFNAKGLNGKNISEFNRYNNQCTKIFLNDGIEIMPCPTTNYMQFIVDINGTKKPNIVGKDIFEFEYGKNSDNRIYGKLLPRFNYDTVEAHIADLPNRCNKNQNGQACASLIMIDGWQIKKHYPW